jgi:protein-S-isoprenylcysteine O-methyltransferase Ste14
MPFRAVVLLWWAWLVYWLAAAGWTKTTRWRESAASRATYTLAAPTALWLLGPARLLPAILHQRIFPASPLLAWLGAAVTAAGLGFNIWARLHLGRNWSGAVTVKEDHELVRTGPYRRIRHPIYTGIILALVGTAVTLGERRGLLALVVVTLALIRKLRLEEARMSETFPDYAAYRRESAALFPFLY